MIVQITLIQNYYNNRLNKNITAYYYNHARANRKL